MRWFRHVMLLALLFVIVVASFVEDLELLLSFNIIQVSSVILLFIIWGIVCVNIYYLIPAFLFKGKYVKYILYITLCILFSTTLLFIIEYLLEKNYHVEHEVLTDGWSVLLFMVVNLFASGFYIFAFSFTIFLQRWVYHKSQINQLQKNKLQSHLNQLKDQVQPEFLSRILNKANELVRSEEQKASYLLMQLSHLLRYQLYDSSREKVILQADISFIKDYLGLEQLLYRKFDYEIITSGDVNHTLIPPLLFIPVIERSIRYLSARRDNGQSILTLKFDVREEYLSFVCVHPLSGLPLVERELENLRTRLDILFEKKYLLHTVKEEGYYYTNLQISTVC